MKIDVLNTLHITVQKLIKKVCFVVVMLPRAFYKIFKNDSEAEG